MCSDTIFLETGTIRPHSAEVSRIELVPLDRLADYDLFSTDSRLLRNNLSRLMPELAV